MNSKDTDEFFSNMKEKLSKASDFGNSLELDNSEKKNKTKRKKESKDSKNKKQKKTNVSPKEDDEQVNSSYSEKQVAELISMKLKTNEYLDESERIWIVDNLEKSKKHKPEVKNNEQKKMLNKKLQTEERFFEGFSGLTSENSDIDPVREMKILFKDKKKGGNKERISKLMSVTFDERRDLILRVRPLIIQVKELYPWLFSFEEIKNEFERLLKVEAADVFYSNVSKYSHGILESSLGALKKKIIDVADAAETSKQKKHIEETGSLLLLPSLVKEKHSFLIMNSKKTSPHVFIRPPSSCKDILDVLNCTGSYQVVVEERVICEPLSLSDALLAMMACFFIFNIQYTEDCHATFTLLECLYLEVPEEFATSAEEIPENTKQKASALKMFANKA